MVSADKIPTPLHTLFQIPTYESAEEEQVTLLAVLTDNDISTVEMVLPLTCYRVVTTFLSKHQCKRGESLVERNKLRQKGSESTLF